MGYDLEGKQRRGECLRYDCARQAPSYVLWRCSRGHRFEALRCPGHIAEAMRDALEGGQYPVCGECVCLNTMTAVLER